MNSSRCSTLLVITLCLLAPVAAAQDDGDQIAVAIPDSIDLSAGIGRTVRGEFSGDLRPDLALLVGQRAYVVGNPSTFQVLVPLGAEEGLLANDLAVLPGATTYGLDLILTVGPSGLEGWEYGPSGEFKSIPIETSVWRGARRVRTGDLNGDVFQDILGVDADGKTLRGLYGHGANEFSAGFAHGLGDTILQTEIVRWVGAQGPGKLAVMSAGKLSILNLVGATVDSLTTVGPSELFDVVRCRGEDTDSLAWITRTPDLEYQWFQLMKPWGASEPGFALGLLGATGVSHGDVDFDQDDEIGILHTYSPHAVLLYNRTGDQGTGGAGTNHFRNSPNDAQVIQIGPLDTSMVGQRAQPSFGDFDLDGDVDGVSPLQGARKLVLQRSALLSESAQRLVIEYSPTNVAVTHSAIVFSIDMLWPQNAPTNATHLEVQMWRRPYGSLRVETDPVHSGAVSLSGLTPGEDAIRVDMTVENEYGESYEENQYPELYLVARLVRRNASGIDVQAWPDTVWQFDSYDFQGDGIQGRTPVPDIDPMDPTRLPPPPNGSPIPSPP